MPRVHIPIASAFFPPFGFHLFSALTVGITAGFCEEVLYRAFLMTEFAEAGYNQTMQVVLPGLVFGLTHAGYLNLARGLSPVARHCASYRVYRDDVGSFVFIGTTQPGSGDGRTLLE